MDAALRIETPGARGPARMRGAGLEMDKGPSVLLWMVLAIMMIAALAYWDEQRESAAALSDFGEEQAMLAKAASAALTVQLSAAQKDALVIARELVRTNASSNAEGSPVFQVSLRARKAPPVNADNGQSLHFVLPFDEQTYLDLLVPTAALLGSVKSLEQPGSVLVLVQLPAELGLVTTTGETVRATEIASALDTAKSWVRVSRADARDLGLPARTAMAGLGRIDAGPLGKWGVAVIATAERERDRELHAQWRLVLGVVVASGLVVAFGGLALRKQRKELTLSRDLAVAAVQKERDERLVRADKLAMMGALATGIAHEVSTPLGVIVGRAEQLQAKVESDDRAKRALDVITEQAERIGRIIREFLSLARGNSPTMEHVHPKDIVRNALELVEHRFANTGVALLTNVALDLPQIACEPRLFEQVMVNLLLNACDACSRGGSVELVVRADAERVAFIVVDDGEGITPEAAARATEPFFTTKAQGKGTGLGLAIANEIVKHHCGTLKIEPRDFAPIPEATHGVGTRVCVELPIALSVSPRIHA